MSAPQRGPRGMTSFVPNGANGYSRRDLAIVLIGAAREAGLNDAKHVIARPGGFYISDEMAELILSEEPEEQEPEPEPEPDKPKTRKKASKKTSGNRAVKDTDSKEE